METLNDSDIKRLQAELIEYISDKGQKCCQKLQPLWLRMFGYDKEFIECRYNTIRCCVEDIFDKMLEEEIENMEDQKNTLQSMIRNCRLLQEELKMEIRVPNNIDIEGSNLFGQIKLFENYLAEYEELKAQRIAKLEQFQNLERECCNKLGEETQYFSFKSVPSEEKLQEIHEHVQQLMKEMDQRCEVHSELVKEIDNLLKDLEIDGDVSSEQRMMLENTERTQITKMKIRNLEKWKLELIEERESQIRYILCLKEQTILLWNLLEIETLIQNSILDKTAKGYGTHVRTIWMEELERCEHLKRKNIKMVIERLRRVIRDFWSDCHLDEKERNVFTRMSDENYDESLLEAHEREEKRMRQYFSDRKDIYMLAKKWFTLWNKMRVLENRSTNTDRLNNRGGQLLKEEKERKAVQKELPNVEMKLEKLIKQFEDNNQSRFLYDGRPLMDVIAEYWEKRREEKENEKESRKVLQSRTPLKSNGVVTTPVSVRSIQKTAKVLVSVENVNRKIPARRELKMPVSTKKGLPRRSRSHDPQIRGENVEPSHIRRVCDTSVVSYTGFQDYFESISRTMKCGMPLRSSPSPSKSSDTIECLKTRTNSVFKSPTSKKLFKKYPFSRNLRPMIH